MFLKCRAKPDIIDDVNLFRRSRNFSFLRLRSSVEAADFLYIAALISFELVFLILGEVRSETLVDRTSLQVSR